MAGWTNQGLWVLLSAVTLLGQSSVLSDDPPIVSRSSWGAQSTSLVKLSSVPIKMFIHHTDGHACSTLAACSSVVRGIQRYHMQDRGWSDIGYSFLIGGDGNVYEGRGWDHVGAHTKGFNDVGLGIAFIGSYSNAEPPILMQRVAESLIEKGVRENKVSANYDLYGHRQATSTTCPGDSLYSLIKKWSHWSPEYIYDNGKCTSVGGVCKENSGSCTGVFTSGKCPGPTNIQCCQP